MKTATDTAADDVASNPVLTLRVLWMSWWDGVWLWIAATIVVGATLAVLCVAPCLAGIRGACRWSRAFHCCRYCRPGTRLTSVSV